MKYMLLIYRNEGNAGASKAEVEQVMAPISLYRGVEECRILARRSPAAATSRPPARRRRQSKVLDGPMPRPRSSSAATTSSTSPISTPLVRGRRSGAGLGTSRCARSGDVGHAREVTSRPPARAAVAGATAEAVRGGATQARRLPRGGSAMSPAEDLVRRLRRALVACRRAAFPTIPSLADGGGTAPADRRGAPRRGARTPYRTSC